MLKESLWETNPLWEYKYVIQSINEEKRAALKGLPASQLEVKQLGLDEKKG